MGRPGPCVRTWYRWTATSAVIGGAVYAGLAAAQEQSPVREIIDASRTNILLNIAGIVALAGFCVAVGRVWSRMDQRSRATEETLDRVERALEHLATKEELEFRQHAADDIHERITGAVLRLEDRVDRISGQRDAPPRRRREQ